MPAQPTTVVVNKAITSLFITVPMFDFAVVHCSVLFNFWFERSVATVQLHRTTALSGQLYSETKCFHVVIIADWRLLVNQKIPNEWLDEPCRQRVSLALLLQSMM
jgi:hypothetical protein